MSQPGASDLTKIRSALLDALSALESHLDAIVVIGAQAIYLHTGAVSLALAEVTNDSDLALDPRVLRNDPLIEAAMKAAGFYPDPLSQQPGAWMSPSGVPVDLMVPEALAGDTRKNARGVRIPPHDNRALRRATGLEAAVIDRAPMTITALALDDPRAFTVNVAGPAALLVAKLHKLGEREGTPRLQNKDAHDVYRLLVAVDTDTLATSTRLLLSDSLAGNITDTAMTHLQQLFAAGPDAAGSAAAGLAEQGVGEPETVAAAVAVLSADLISALGL